MRRILRSRGGNAREGRVAPHARGETLLVLKRAFRAGLHGYRGASLARAQPAQGCRGLEGLGDFLADHDEAPIRVDDVKLAHVVVALEQVAHSVAPLVTGYVSPEARDVLHFEVNRDLSLQRGEDFLAG